MMLRVAAAAVAVSSVLGFAVALADDFGGPVPMGAGEVLIQYEANKPSEEQMRICARIGGEITQRKDGTYVCVRRSL